MERLERCNLCEGTRFSLFAEKAGHKTMQLFRVVECDGCGLKFVSPRLTEEENRALYDEAYFNGEGFDASVNYVLLDEEAHTRVGENAGILAKIAALQGRKGLRVLDVGCGTGCLLRALVAAGYDDVWGVELSPYAAKLATRVPGVKVLTGDLLELDLPPASFDVINATEVIEHLRDPLASFRRIKELLAPGGVFIYSTGNAKGLYARVLGRRWPYLHPEGHLFYYTPETLGRYFEKVGLTPLSLERMGKPARTAFLSAEDQMAHSMLLYIGGSDRGMKGRIFRTVGALENPIIQRLVTTVVGKHRLPIAINGAAPTT